MTCLKAVYIPSRLSSCVRRARRSFEHIQAQRQDIAQPRGRVRCDRDSHCGARMEKDSQSIAFKHEQRQQRSNDASNSHAKATWYLDCKCGQTSQRPNVTSANAALRRLR